MQISTKEMNVIPWIPAVGSIILCLILGPVLIFGDGPLVSKLFGAVGLIIGIAGLVYLIANL